MNRNHVIVFLALLSLSLATSGALAQGRSSKGDSRGKAGQSVEQMQEAAEEAEQDKGSKEKSSAAPEKLTTEEREALGEEEGPGILGRMRRFFGWERSQERMSEQGREHQRATEQDRGPGDSQED